MRVHGATGFALIGVVNFLGQYHYYLFAFVLSAFLATFVGETEVGLVVAASSLAAMAVLLVAPRLFARIGTRELLALLALAEMATLIGFSLVTQPAAVISLFIVQSAIVYALFIGIDLLIETHTRSEAATGTARGLILTISNIAVLTATYSLSLIAIDDAYHRVFGAAALVLIPFILIALRGLPGISNSAHAQSHRDTRLFTELVRNPSLRAIVGAHCMLQLFFSWMTVYAPLYLLNDIGFSWSEIGIIFTFAMVPYIVLEYPVGLIADRWLGEKEFLIVGFLILAASTVGMGYLSSGGLLVWIVVMIVSRIGAALIEATTEIHFFRHVDQNDPGAITLFRVLRPLASVIAPLGASALLFIMPLNATFVVFGTVLFLGVPLALSIVDSK